MMTLDVRVRLKANLDEYVCYPDVMVAQDTPAVTFHRRSDGWKPIILASADAVAEFRSIGLHFSLAQICGDELSGTAG